MTTEEALEGRSLRFPVSCTCPGSLLPSLLWVWLPHSSLCVFLSFFLFLLSDQVFPPTCNIGKNFLSLNYLAEYLQPKAAEGCVMSSQPKDKEVHIIELITPNSNPYRWVSVSVCVFSEPRDENKDMMWLDKILTWGRERLSPPSCEREGAASIHRIFEENSKDTSVVFYFLISL